MKQFFLVLLAIVVFSCSGNRQQQAGKACSAYELDSLLTVVEQVVDDTITVIGYVTHTCKHSGKRCFIVGESQEATLRVEAAGEIETFSSELIGSKLAITGVMKEDRLSQEDIDAREVNVKEKEQEEGMEEACAAELTNICQMRKWMEDNNKEYYAIPYMDGLKYKVLE